ncbi:winged helix-turn-helix transcriptional regulator [Gellertiella hungarica]|uniref:DNA-binding HxlR family transcriptional regulator n=1 Tax=Gellertiella hungarica TaxID=1572859 RepID=A0A7W6J8A0_9HYPH|nr:helix-turn-helix domain-containing protein [Gellertiella hungarica]MBB4066616.1 DNA-binding HxlR family transcriptional regulator [Gellertiella hungarica]
MPNYYEPCQCGRVSEVLQRVGDKWSVLVIMMLGDEALRFNELRRRIGGISQRMLTLTLRTLERDGMVNRTVHPTVPPQVEYALTPLGRSLWEPVEALGKWAHQNLPNIDRARQAYDSANGVAASAHEAEEA